MDKDDSFQNELLHFAVRDGDLDQVNRLLSEGHDINAFDDLGKTPLHYAVEKEHFAVAEYLIQHGADVNAHHEPSIGNTPLGEIAGTCSFRIAKLLVDSGADPTIAGWMQLNALDRAQQRKRGDGPQVRELLFRASSRRHAEQAKRRGKKTSGEGEADSGTPQQAGRASEQTESQGVICDRHLFTENGNA